MTDERQEETTIDREKALSIAAGQANATQSMLVGVHNSCGEAVVANGIAQYVAQGAEGQDPRQHWNRWVSNLRDIYFTYAGMDKPV